MYSAQHGIIVTHTRGFLHDSLLQQSFISLISQIRPVAAWMEGYKTDSFRWLLPDFSLSMEAPKGIPAAIPSFD